MDEDTKQAKFIYKGFFKDNDYHGKGTKTTAGSVYFGNFSQGIIQGIGLLTISESNFYLGCFKNNSKEGYGVEHIDGDQFEGEFVAGQRHGIGRYTQKSTGITYTGTFEFGKRAGFGRLESQDYIYVGGWDNEKKNGVGYQSQTTSEGGSYFGYWKNDLRHGIGYEIGKEYDYKGEWKDDKPHGYALITVRGKEQRAAKFFEGKLENYIDGNLEELAKKFEEMNFDNFFQMARRKLILIDEYIDDERNKLKKEYAELGNNFDDEENELNVKIKKIVDYVGDIKNEVEEDFQRFLHQASGLESTFKN